jgi:hypothetical protein
VAEKEGGCTKETLATSVGVTVKTLGSKLDVLPDVNGASETAAGSSSAQSKTGQRGLGKYEDRWESQQCGLLPNGKYRTENLHPATYVMELTSR